MPRRKAIRDIYLNKEVHNPAKENYSNLAKNKIRLPWEASPITSKKYQRWRVKNISKISTYTGCTIHEYKLPKDGRWKKCKGYAIHKSIFYKSRLIVQHIKHNKLLKCVAFGATQTLLGIKPEKYDPDMLLELKQKVINKGIFYLKLIKPISQKKNI